jgi:predicted SAM-dependent methyltransferase
VTAVARSLLDGTTRFVGWAHRNRRLRPSEPVKVNLGAGLMVAPGWLNVDASLNALFAPAPSPVLCFLFELTSLKRWHTRSDYIRTLREHRYVHHDLRYGIPLEDETASFTYSSHFLEHLSRMEAERFVREIYRVLVPGGRARICVPDLELAVDWYTNGDKLRSLSLIFEDSTASAAAAHRWMYDFDLLRTLLEGRGFVDIERCKFREGKTPDIDALDNRPSKTLFVEAIKPQRLRVNARQVRRPVAAASVEWVGPK